MIWRYRASHTSSNCKENAPTRKSTFHASLTKIIRRSNLEFISVDWRELVEIVLEYIHSKQSSWHKQRSIMHYFLMKKHFLLMGYDVEAAVAMAIDLASKVSGLTH